MQPKREMLDMMYSGAPGGDTEKSETAARAEPRDEPAKRPDNPWQFPRPREDMATPGGGKGKPSPLSLSDGAAVFRNPLVPTSPAKPKRKHRPEPLVIPQHVNNFGFQVNMVNIHFLFVRGVGTCVSMATI